MKDWTGNKTSIYKSIGASNHSEVEREENDFYATDPLAIDKLLKVEWLNDRVWECACGTGHLSRRLTENGITVVSTDIVDRGYHDFSYILDFLKAEKSPFDSNFDIVTNPPYKYAKEFVLKALKLLPIRCKCCMFLKLTFLEGKARFNEIFKDFPPKRVYVFSERIQCAKNGDFERMKASGGSAVAYAWFVWRKGNKGKTKIEWI
ncbi:MAG: NAD(P)-dependent oxidoreductase [Clostridia bacterium]|nr:NAD(P)-dependent oxidoreductase [Clostridia bacterium]